MSRDLVIGTAIGYDWAALEPFAVSLIRSGYIGDKVLFVRDLNSEAKKNLLDLGFSLLNLPPIDFSTPSIQTGKYFTYVGRFILIHQFLYENPGYRFVICSDTRDVVFQHNPIKWLEENIGKDKLVAASEYIRHEDQEGNASWVDQAFREVNAWLLPKTVYCSGFISGHADYVSDLAMAIYLMGRHLSGHVWGADQPAYNALMHQKAYADMTCVPTMADLYCLNMVVLAFKKYRDMMLDLPPATAPTNICIGDGDETYSLPDLKAFTVLHQYDRIPPLAAQIRQEYCLARVNQNPLQLEPTKFLTIS